MLQCKINNYSDKNFVRHLYLFEYDGIIKEKIIQYKFKDKAYLNEMFVNFIVKNKKICGFLKNYDIIIPTPISKSRKKIRGYNQTELIARKICDKTNILHFEKDILIKTKNIVPQSTLTRKERQQNVQNAYDVINTEKIQDKKVLLFDDVYTTGSTVNECSRMLKMSGASMVDVLTIAKDST